MGLRRALRRFEGHLEAMRFRRPRQRYLPQLFEGIDRERFDEIETRYMRADFDPVGPLKYFDLSTYLARDLDRAIWLGLHRSRPLRVLDLGCGFGYFLYVCTFFGHQGIGVDYVDGNQPDVACYRETLALLGQRRQLHRIVRFEKLPDVEGAFDLVTAHAMCFNWHENRRDQPWGVAEWQYFLDDVKTRLVPSGRVLLEFVPLGPGLPCFDETLRAYFRQRGARIGSDRKTVYFRSIDGS